MYDDEEFGEVAQDLENIVSQMRNAFNAMDMINRDMRAKKGTPETYAEMYG